jgi:hypothetical protein
VGLKKIPPFIASPHFNNLTSSKSNLALSVSALCLEVQVSAAVLHLSCNPPSNGNERVADKPKLFAKVFF